MRNLRCMMGDVILNKEDKINGKELRGDKRLQISEKAVDELVKGKSVIKCKDGVAQIDKSHPAYDFWLED